MAMFQQRIGTKSSDENRCSLSRLVERKDKRSRRRGEHRIVERRLDTELDCHGSAEQKQ
jgi:hypothetical protein